MALIKSIAGIRGTIGGMPGESLTSIDVVKFTAAFAHVIAHEVEHPTIVIGRDARPSGHLYAPLVANTLRSMGVNVIDLGLSTTPTVEMAVKHHHATAGIILTASHNPAGWNALKLLNEKGEFIDDATGRKVLEVAESLEIHFAEPKRFGSYTVNDTFLDDHISQILALPLVNAAAIKEKKFKVMVDAVNSTGGIAIPKLLRMLGCEVTELYCEPNGQFPHNPEPLPENLTHLCTEMANGHFDLGIAVDPDVDRLALVAENGEPFGEEYTLVTIADYVLSKKPGSTVSNLSSTRALRDVTEKRGGQYFAAAVGEVNVVAMMKAQNAVIGGEGNGGVILPELHYGRDALVGVALILSALAEFGKSASMYRAKFPNYYISKNKIELTPEIDIDLIMEKLQQKYVKNPINTVDGVKIEFGEEWVHLRKSNTEPIIRIFAESSSHATADHLALKLISDIRELIAH